MSIWRRKETAPDPQRTTASVKHGGGNIIAQACMAASGPESLLFTDDVAG